MRRLQRIAYRPLVTTIPLNDRSHIFHRLEPTPPCVSRSYAHLAPRAMMLALCRNVPQAHGSLTGGAWERPKFKGTELYGKTLGVIAPPQNPCIAR